MSRDYNEKEWQKEVLRNFEEKNFAELKRQLFVEENGELVVPDGLKQASFYMKRDHRLLVSGVFLEILKLLLTSFLYL